MNKEQSSLKTWTFNRSTANQSGKSLRSQLITLTTHGLAPLLIVGWAISAAITTALQKPSIQFLERQTQVSFFRLRGTVPVPSQVVILALDEDSLNQAEQYRASPERLSYLEPLQAWPWKRVAYARAIDRLMQAGAKSVALDIWFDTPSTYGEEDDKALKTVLQRYAGKVVLAARYDLPQNRQGDLFQIVTPHDGLTTTPMVVGAVNYPLEPNGKVHRLSSEFPKILQQEYASGGDQAQILQQLLASTPSFDDAILQASHLTPQGQGNQIFYYGPQNTFERIPFWYVLDPNNWNTYLKNGAYFKDKIVLIGATAASFQDTWDTPFNRMPGVEIHANAVATLLQGTAIRNGLPDGPIAGVVVLVGVGLAGLIHYRLERAVWRLGSALVLAIGWGIGSYLIFTQAKLVLPTFVPMAAIVGMGFTSFAAGAVNAHWRKLELRRTLKHYAASPLVQEIINQQDDLRDLLQEREQAILGKKLGGRYQITGVLGAGGFGETYLARDIQRPGQPQCVVKQLRPASNSLKMLQLSRRLFHREAETLERLGKHDQIPQLLAYFEEDEEFYLVQEFVAGRPLSEQLSLGRQLPEVRIITLLVELLTILEFVHSNGVIHRDIKPSNIIQRQIDGRLVLIDFGAVKELHQITEDEGQTGMTVGIGTQGYMPNEQCAGNPRFNSDIYALGMTAIQALIGLPPSQLKEDPKTGEILWQDRIQVSQSLVTILNKMVRYDYRNRYRSATEVLQDLQKLMGVGATLSLAEFALPPLTGEQEPPVSTQPWPDTFGSDVQVPPTEQPPTQLWDEE